MLNYLNKTRSINSFAIVTVNLAKMCSFVAFNCKLKGIWTIEMYGRQTRKKPQFLIILFFDFLEFEVDLCDIFLFFFVQFSMAKLFIHFIFYIFTYFETWRRFEKDSIVDCVPNENGRCSSNWLWIELTLKFAYRAVLVVVNLWFFFILRCKKRLPFVKWKAKSLRKGTTSSKERRWS